MKFSEKRSVEMENESVPQKKAEEQIARTEKVPSPKQNPPAAKKKAWRAAMFKYSWKHRDYIGFTIGFLLLMFVGLPLMVNHKALFGWLAISDSPGTIGDAIGGVTAPFIAFLGALLVYRSFKEQVEANRIQSDALRSDKEIALIHDLHRECIETMKDLKYFSEEGSVALESFGRDLDFELKQAKKAKTDPEDKTDYGTQFDTIFDSNRRLLKQVVLVCMTFSLAADRIAKAETITPEERSLYLNRLKSLAVCKLMPGVRQLRNALAYFPKRRKYDDGTRIAINDFLQLLDLSKDATLKRVRRIDPVKQSTVVTGG